MNKYKAIIDLIRREDVTLFVGSGCSINSGAPTGNQLAKTLLALLEKDYQDEVNQSLQDISEALVIQDGNKRSRLNSVLENSFNGLAPSSFHQNLFKIPHIHTIITTNYDSLIEDAYPRDYLQVIANDNELSSIKTHNVQLLKIHGDLKHIEDIIITKTDYRQTLEKPKHELLWSRVISEFSSKHIVFVGYSADDQNILNLIEKIQRNISGGIKQMFIVTPSLTKIQGKRLQNLGIKHYCGTGEDFLQNTISELKESFGEDKYNNICSQDTLNRFALLSGILFSFENNGKHTSITRWRSLNGDPCKLTMNFTTKWPDFIGNRQPSSITEIIKGFSVPMYALNEEELATFRMSINDLRINGWSEMQKVLIGPAINDLAVELISLNRKIYCRSKAKRYVNKGICHILIPTPMFNIELELTIADLTNSTFSGRWTTKLTEESFDNLEEAIKWSKLLVFMKNGEQIQFRLGTIQLENLNFSNKNEVLPKFEDWLEYCNNLHEIEITGRLFFPYYECFTPDSYFCSKIILSYLKHKPFIDAPRKELMSFNVDVDKGAFQENGEYVARIVTRINGPVSLCGKSFSVDEERVFFRRCKIESVISLDNEKDTLHFINLNDTVQYEYCDENEPDRIIEE